MGIFGRNSVGIDGTLTTAVGQIGITRTGSISDSITSFGDLYPMISMKWHDGVHNWMAYVTGDIPVGAYDSGRLANIGIGHGAIDGGGGYTYLNPMTGHEFSAVGGFTYNFKNPDTQVQSGSTSISTGAFRNSCRSRFSSARSGTHTSNSQTTLAHIRSRTASDRVLLD